MNSDSATVDRLAIHNATLQAENRYLRRVVRDSRHGRKLRRAVADAQTLLVWRFSGLPISRRFAHGMGMSERRWMAARALLVLARIHDGEDITERDFDACTQAVRTVAGRLERDGLARLHLRMARNGR